MDLKFMFFVPASLTSERLYDWAMQYSDGPAGGLSEEGGGDRGSREKQKKSVDTKIMSENN